MKLMLIFIVGLAFLCFDPAFGQRVGPGRGRRGPGSQGLGPRPNPLKNDLCKLANQVYISCNGRDELPRCEPECGEETDDGCSTQCNNDGFVCICGRGFILKDGQCVPIDQCPQDERPEGRRPQAGMPRPRPMQSNKCEMADQMYIACDGRNELPRCEPECGVETDNECTTQCNDDGFICICRRGFILKDGQCVPIDQCPEDERPAGRPAMPRPKPMLSGKCEMADQVYITCNGRDELPRCEPECGVEKDDECSTQCNNDGFICICRPGFILKDGQCVPIDQCPEDQRPEKRRSMSRLMQGNKCEGNKEVFIKCRSLFRSLPCELECGKEREVGCRKECEGEGYCRCAPGYMRKEGDCVPRNQCEGAKNTGGGKFRRLQSGRNMLRGLANQFTGRFGK